jgi:hypothetical protein
MRAPNASNGPKLHLDVLGGFVPALTTDAATGFWNRLGNTPLRRSLGAGGGRDAGARDPARTPGHQRRARPALSDR